MARSLGSAARERYMQSLLGLLMARVLPGAARTGAKVIAGEAKHLLGGRQADAGAGKVLIADSVKVRVRERNGLIVARVSLSGPGAYVGRWLEYGTKAHFISVDPGLKLGTTAKRVNTRIADGDADLKATLVINGKPVGTTVYHPGATERPFLRPALDTKQTEAVAAAQAYIDKRVRRSGIIAAAEQEDDA